MFLRPRYLLLFLILISFLYSQTQPSNPSAPVSTFKANVRVVLVDVVVTAGKDEPVSALHKSDFEILEDGKPQTISTFEEHKGTPTTQVKLPPMPPGIYTNYPTIQTSDSVNVLLLDALNTDTQDQTYVHTQMIKYLRTVPPGTRMAIFTLASRLRMIQPMTSETDALLAELNSKKSGAAGPHPSPLLPSAVEKDADQHVLDFMQQESQGTSNSQFVPASSMPGAIDPINSMRQFLQDSANFQRELRIRMTLLAMQQLGRYLSDVPGRKNIIWFSGSFPLAIFPDRDLPDPSVGANEFSQEIQQTGDMLTAGHIAIYPIAATGLKTNAIYQADATEIQQERPSIMGSRNQTRALRTERTERDSNYETMEELARTTGGKAFYDTNGLGEALLRVINDGAHYYTITYVPTNAKIDGKYRHIEVKTTSGKYKLAYRHGYYADDLARQSQPDSDPLLPMMGVNLPNLSQILYKVRLLPSNPQPAADAPLLGSNTELKGLHTRYTADFAVAVQDLKLNVTPDGVHHGDVEIMMVAYDHEGRPLNMVIKRAGLLLKPNVYKSMEKVGLQMKSEIDVPQGDVLLRTGIFDLDANQAGTLMIPLNPTTIQAQNKAH
jgi:VWFA-related protein